MIVKTPEYDVIEKLRKRHAMGLTPEETFYKFSTDLCMLDFENLSTIKSLDSLISELRSLFDLVVVKEIRTNAQMEYLNPVFRCFWFINSNYISSYIAPTNLHFHANDMLEILDEEKSTGIFMKSIRRVGFDIGGIK